MSSVPWLPKSFRPRKGHPTGSVDGNRLTVNSDYRTKPAHRQARLSAKEGSQSVAALLFCPGLQPSQAREIRP
jgi:hypothetical protein